MGDGIFRQYGNPIGSNQFRNAVVDFRVDMVGPSGQDNPPHMIFFHIAEGFFPFFLNIFPGIAQFCPSCIRRINDFLGGDFRKFLNQRFGGGADIPEGHEGIAQEHFPTPDFLHIIFNILRIGGNDRAVIVVVSRLEFIALIKEGRIEDKIHFFMNQPAYMAMSQFSRVAFRFAGDGFYAKRINIMVGKGGKYYLISQSGKKGEPEGVVLVHI